MEDRKPTADPIALLPEGRRILIFGLMAFGQFMALLDIQIVAGSLNAIQAGLNAGPDEIAWVQTAYLMAEIVMIPLAGFLAQALSTRWLYTLSAGLFTLCSLLCGLAWDMDSMIAFRALQGFTGGAMVPLVLATGFRLFEGPKRSIVMGVLGLASTLAPTVGPSIGGVVTDLAGWRWIFFMNLAPGLALTLFLPLLGRVDDAKPEMLQRIDWLQVSSLAAFLGGLQYVLEEGPRHEWFGDPAIQTAAWLSTVAGVVFFVRSFSSTLPVVRLAPLRRPAFALACVASLVVGFAIYGGTYLTPLYLGRIRGYSSLQIGATVSITGLVMILASVAATRLSSRTDPRYVVGLGFSLTAASLWSFSHVTSEWGFAELLWPQVLRGMGGPLSIMPLIQLSLTGVPREELHDASGLFNLMRNLGGAGGIALINTWLIDFTQVHRMELSAAMGEQPDRAMAMMRGIGRMADGWTPDGARAAGMAQGVMGQMLGREAATLAFADAYRLMAFVCLTVAVMTPLLRRPQDGAQAQPV